MKRVQVGNRSFELSETLSGDYLAPIFDDAWTASRVWDASAFLAEHLLTLDGWDECNVVELGSGCGLSGLVTATLGANVVLTDQSQVLELLQQNADSNLGASERRRVQIAEFRWGTTMSLPFEQVDCILVSDCINPIYGSDSWRQLAQSIRRLSHADTVTYLAYESRGDDASLADFFQCIEHILTYERVLVQPPLSLYKLKPVSDPTVR